MNFPDWYTPKRDYIVVHPLHKPNMKGVEALTNVRYLDFIEEGQMIFMRGGQPYLNYSHYLPQRDIGAEYENTLLNNLDSLYEE